ncbi:hypothetical protein [Natronococcus occultus]|uniref:Uncharacterized protein n=1 Tax=Natronococcus occultus SP4 TaxID=694430 RepID=L0K4P5_9EURY|nr:hypothetical protein [Natronococcus occultus]AGB39314.1 hypothetical protein Natoc_3596 [Natronococcus occultus SP4]
MRRRTILHGVASGIAAGSGVIGREDDDREPSLERRGGRCAGDERNGATVRCPDDGVVIEGLIRTPTPCHEIALESVSRPDDRDVLEVAIRVGSLDGVCVQCLGVVEYRLELPVDRRENERVEIVHVRAEETVRAPASERETD